MSTWSPVNTYHHEEDCKMKTLCQLYWRKELAQSQCHISGRKLLIPPRCIVPVHRYVPVHSTRAIQYHGYFRQVLLIFIFFSLISFFFFHVSPGRRPTSTPSKPASMLFRAPWANCPTHVLISSTVIGRGTGNGCTTSRKTQGEVGKGRAVSVSVGGG